MQMTKKSANEVTSRKSRIRMSIAFLESAARAATTQGGTGLGFGLASAIERVAWRINCYSCSHATLETVMRQLCLLLLFVAGLTAAAQTAESNTDTTPAVGNAIADKKIDLAKQNLQRIADLVKAGALPRVRLEEAELDMTDVEDDAILARTLYGDLPIQDLSEKMSEDMVAAAQRRVDRQQNRMLLAQKMVGDGVTAASTLIPIQDELKMRELNLSLAHSLCSAGMNQRSPVPRYAAKQLVLFLKPDKEHVFGLLE